MARERAVALFVTALCMLTIDPKTGEVRLLRIVEVKVNPDYL